MSEPDPKIAQSILDGFVEEVLRSFGALTVVCHHRNGTDCGEPSMDFSHMLCDPSNCPLLAKTWADSEFDKPEG